MPNDELELIKTIRKTIGNPSKNVLLGIGDDAAVLKPARGNLVATTDSMVEGVHFDLAYTNAEELGHKALAVNLSDLAAMGATPQFALVTLGLKQDISELFVVQLYEGMRRLSRKYKVDLVGGNLVQSPQTNFIDVTALGVCSDRFFTRSGAQPGDLIVVSGSLGTSAAALTAIRRLGRQQIQERPILLKAHLQPEPRLKESQCLNNQRGVTSMIDVSDGLAREIHHIANASKVGFILYESELPLAEDTLWIAQELQANPRLWALYGGEDYELLFTVTPQRWKSISPSLKQLKTPFTVIGRVLPRRHGRRIQTLSGAVTSLESRGWNHFVRRRKTPLSAE